MLTTPGSTLNPIITDKEYSLYEFSVEASAAIRQVIFSSPETRRICNDPFLSGVEYTSALRRGCAKALQAMQQHSILRLAEENTVVLHILRGGLNFGLREALFEALGFNRHSSAFVSAQRARKKDHPEDWIITESDYQKLSLHGVSHIIFGDVVATGTSLEHALQRLLATAKKNKSQIGTITFFTIGSARSFEILTAIDCRCRQLFNAYQGSCAVYLEGVFETATVHTPMHIKIDGTDLLRANAVLAPEFVESQYEVPSYPIERCVIYDAGSRAFDLPEYFRDVQDYWLKTQSLAAAGMSYAELLAERFPALDVKRFPNINLQELCEKQLAKVPSLSATDRL